MIIGKLENGDIRLHFKDHIKTLSEKEWQDTVKGFIVVKNASLTDKEYAELHNNIEAKRTGQGLMDINKELLKMVSE